MRPHFSREFPRDRHSRERGNPGNLGAHRKLFWIPDCTGMTGDRGRSQRIREWAVRSKRNNPFQRIWTRRDFKLFIQPRGEIGLCVEVVAKPLQHVQRLPEFVRRGSGTARNLGASRSAPTVTMPHREVLQPLLEQPPRAPKRSQVMRFAAEERHLAALRGGYPHGLQ